MERYLKQKLNISLQHADCWFKYIVNLSIANDIIDYPVLKSFELDIDSKNRGVEEIRYQAAIVQTYISLSRKWNSLDKSSEQTLIQ